jgi:hypothetical protein
MTMAFSRLPPSARARARAGAGGRRKPKVRARRMSYKKTVVENTIVLAGRRGGSAGGSMSIKTLFRKT